MSGDWWDREGDAGPQRPRKPRRWRDKFREAFRGVKLGVRGHSSFFVHFFFAALALAAALVLHCDVFEWCLVIGCIGLVVTAELFNSAHRNDVPRARRGIEKARSKDASTSRPARSWSPA